MRISDSISSVNREFIEIKINEMFHTEGYVGIEKSLKSCSNEDH